MDILNPHPRRQIHIFLQKTYTHQPLCPLQFLCPLILQRQCHQIPYKTSSHPMLPPTLTKRTGHNLHNLLQIGHPLTESFFCRIVSWRKWSSASKVYDWSQSFVFQSWQRHHWKTLLTLQARFRAYELQQFYWPLFSVTFSELNINSLFTSIFSYCILSSWFTSDSIKSLCIKLFYCSMLFYYKFENSMKKVYIFSPWCLLLYYNL